MSIARRHLQRTLATRESRAAAGAPGPQTGPMADRMLALLRMHQAELKTIQSRTAKIAAKRGWLADYAPYVDGVLAADGGAQDEVLVTVMLWRLDAGDLAGALDIAAYAVRHGLAMPERFARDLPTTLLEEIAEAALTALATDAAPAMAEPVAAALELTGDCDMPDEVRAKAHKALGLIFKATDPARAATHLETALALDARSGVKTELSRLRKAMEPAAGT